MKIAILHYSSPPIVGGVESVLAHHARLMADAGHEFPFLPGEENLLIIVSRSTYYPVWTPAILMS